MLASPERLNEDSRRLLRSTENQLFVSAASVWEIAIKHSIERLHLPQEPAVLVPKWLAESRVSPLAVEHGHAAYVASLPLYHRDPFDRLLVAQAKLERLPIMTSDRLLAAYDVDLLPA